MTDATVEEATHTLAVTVDDESEMVGYFDNVSALPGNTAQLHQTVALRIILYPHA